MYIGDAHINFELNIIETPKGEIYVEPKIMRLLKFLVDNPNIVHSRENLITTVWGVDYGGDERLSRAISILRKALGEEKGKRKYIETISRKGYRLIADVSIEKPEIITQSDAANSVVKKPSLNWIAAGLAGAIISAALIFLFLPQRSPTSADSLISVSGALTEGYNGIRYFGHDGAIKNSQKRFTEVLEQDPENAAAHAGLALSYIREYTALESDPALLKQARASALRALERNEHLALSHIAMGWSAEFQKETDKALQYLERADLLDKDNPFILESRIRILGSSGNLKGAKEMVMESISKHPQNAIFNNYAVRLYLAENDLSNAEVYAKRSLELDPENPWFYSSTAQILHMQDKTSEAIKTIQAGLEVQESASLYNNLATYLFFQGYYDLAASAYEKTLELEGNSHNPLFWANLGDAYRWVPGKAELSVKYYDRALQLWQDKLRDNPDSLTLQTRIALYNSKKQVGPKPEELIERVLSTDNLGSVFYYRMLVTAELWGDRENALNLLKKSINAGYPLNEVRNDPELKALREDQAYHLIVSN